VQPVTGFHVASVHSISVAWGTLLSSIFCSFSASLVEPAALSPLSWHYPPLGGTPFTVTERGRSSRQVRVQHMAGFRSRGRLPQTRGRFSALFPYVATLTPLFLVRIRVSHPT
jgi:hypothetical protein